MKRLFWFFLLWPFFEARAFASEAEFHNFCSLWHILATLLDNTLHITSLCSNHSLCNLELFFIRDLNIVSTSILCRAIAAANLLTLVSALALIVALIESCWLRQALVRNISCWYEIRRAGLQLSNEGSVNILLLKLCIQKLLNRSSEPSICGICSTFLLSILMNLGCRALTCLTFSLWDCAITTAWLEFGPVNAHLLYWAWSSSLHLVDSLVTSLCYILLI